MVIISLVPSPTSGRHFILAGSGAGNETRLLSVTICLLLELIEWFLAFCQALNIVYYIKVKSVAIQDYRGGAAPP